MSGFWRNQRSVEPTTTMSAAELVGRGYRCVSSSHSMIARIDRPDWLEYMVRKMGVKRPENIGWRLGDAADQYRRIYSRDVHVVARDILVGIPTSSHDPVGFIA